MTEDFEKEMNEYMAEEDKKETPLPEAPASANIKCWIKGYGVMFTFRGNKATDVIGHVSKLIELAEKSGWKTKWDDDSPAVPGETSSDPDWVAEGSEDYCSIHKTKMRQYSKNGQTWYSHRLPDGSWCNGKAK